MSQRLAHERPRTTIFQSLAVTAIAVALPVFLLLRLMSARPNMPVITSIVAGLALVILGTLFARLVFWRTLRAHRLQIVDLFIWSWARRRYHERKLYDKVAALGLLDDTGAPQLPKRRQLELLTELSNSLEANDPYTHGHSRRVARHAYRTAATLGLPAKQIEVLKRAAQLHDVGKLDVPVAVLQKNGRLTDEERSLMEQHAMYGAEMVSVLQDDDLLLAVLYHHERWDGAGYPDRLTAEEIPLMARVIAVTDAYDAITSARPYRSAESRRSAIEIIRKERGHHFDPEIADAFLASLPSLPLALAPLGFLSVPFKIFGGLAGWVRGLGRDYAPAAAAVGLAIVVGGASLPPKSPPPALASSDAVVGPAGAAEPAGAPPDVVKGKRIHKADPPVAEVVADAAPDAPPASQPPPTGLPAQTPPDRNPPKEPKPEPSPQEPKPTPPAEPPAAQPSGEEPPGNVLHCEGGDPRPGKGKDCVQPGKLDHGKGIGSESRGNGKSL